jgi:hypothetical protein
MKKLAKTFRSFLALSSQKIEADESQERTKLSPAINTKKINSSPAEVFDLLFLPRWAIPIAVNLLQAGRTINLHTYVD